MKLAEFLAFPFPTLVLDRSFGMMQTAGTTSGPDRQSAAEVRPIRQNHYYDYEYALTRQLCKFSRSFSGDDRQPITNARL